jgi:hypothetical protein
MISNGIIKSGFGDIPQIFSHNVLKKDKEAI